MICEIESITAVPPQICQIIRVPKENDQAFEQNEASTILYLCVCLFVPIGLKLYYL